MDIPQRPLAIAFDVIETLFPLDPLEAGFRDAGLADGLVRHWFDRTLRNAFALAASGGHHAFRDVAVSALRELTGDRVPQGTAEALVAEMAALDARADAEPAMRRAHESGVAVLTLTNGAAETTRRLLDGAGLSGYVRRVVSIDEVGRGKPAPEPYRYAADVSGVEPRRLALVAAHGWDVHGARSAGLVTGWSSHLEGRFPAVFDPADVVGDDLLSVVDGLLMR